MIILPFIPILALLVQTVYMLNGILEYRHEISEIETQVSVEIKCSIEQCFLLNQYVIFANTIKCTKII